MADENIEIGVSVGASKAKEDIAFLEKFLAESTAGVEELTVAEKELVSVQEQLNDALESVSFRNVKSGFEGVINQLDVFDEKTKDVMDGLKGLATGDIGEVIKAAVKIGTAAWHEHAEAVELATTAYRKYQDEYNKDGAFNKNEKALQKSMLEQEAIGTDSDEVQRKNRIEAGKREQGWSRPGTWSRWGEDKLQGFADLVSYGDSGYSDESAEAEGRKAQARQANIDANNKKEEKRRKDAEDAAAADMEQIRLDDLDREKVRLAETKKREKDREDAAKREDEAAMAAGRRQLDNESELAKEEEKLKGMEKRQSRKDAMDAISAQKEKNPEFMKAGDALYDSILKNSASTGKSAEQIAEERKAQAQKFHEEDVKLQEKIIAALDKKVKAGLASP